MRLAWGEPDPFYEIWNEPDMGGQMFFTGSPEAYRNLYRYGAKGIREGDRDAIVGGPALAYDLGYLAAIRSEALDFASIHAYRNYGSQIAGLRKGLGDRPEAPLFITEYASYTEAEMPPNGPQSRYPAAMRFFHDVKGMLDYPDLAKVYWAQWLDAGEGPGLGLVTWDGHRNAIFNAFKLYHCLPVDRIAVEPEGADGIQLMASSDERNAGIVLWNEGAEERHVTVHVLHLPFTSCAGQLFRIDRGHASYLDDPASEDLRACATIPIRRSSASWSGLIPAESVAYLKLSAHGDPVPVPVRSLGTYARSRYWFADRSATAYADFDPRSWTVRLGLGSREEGIAQIGCVVCDPALRFRVLVRNDGPFSRGSRESLVGFRIDFPSARGINSKSVLFRNGRYDPDPTGALSRRPEGVRADETHVKHEMDDGRPFEVDLSRIAPPKWNRKRILFTFILQNTGSGSRARITLVPEAP